jgi:FKBP-type peptidyl-prolyl cis-trans isomerase 2
LDSNELKPRISRNSIVYLGYTLSVDGIEIDSMDEKDPLIFTQGKGEIISGLEHELYGMHEGDIKKVRIEPIYAYGEVNPELIVTLQRSDFPKEIPLLEETILEINDRNRTKVEGKVLKIKGEDIQIDLNHPLAGKVLDFNIKICKILSNDK